jgi:hypothetical protein
MGSAFAEAPPGRPVRKPAQCPNTGRAAGSGRPSGSAGSAVTPATAAMPAATANADRNPPTPLAPTPTGTFTKNTQRHPGPDVNAPPISSAEVCATPDANDAAVNAIRPSRKARRGVYLLQVLHRIPPPIVEVEQCCSSFTVTGSPR